MKKCDKKVFELSLDNFKNVKKNIISFGFNQTNLHNVHSNSAELLFVIPFQRELSYVL